MTQLDGYVVMECVWLDDNHKDIKRYVDMSGSLSYEHGASRYVGMIVITLSNCNQPFNITVTLTSLSCYEWPCKHDLCKMPCHEISKFQAC